MRKRKKKNIIAKATGAPIPDKKQIHEYRMKEIEKKQKRLEKLREQRRMLETEGKKIDFSKVTIKDIAESFNDMMKKYGQDVNIDVEIKEKTDVKQVETRKLTISKNVGVVNVKPLLTYGKEIQTIHSYLEEERRRKEDRELEEKREKDRESKKEDVVKIDRKGEDEKEVEVDVEKIMISDDFQKFFSKSTLKIERCLANKYDPLFMLGESQSSQGESVDEKVVLENVFECEFVKDRPITNIFFSESKKYSNMFLGSYYRKPYESEVEGAVVVWSQMLSDRPECILTCENPISNAIFYKYSPSVIIGGTYFGELVFWDIRTGSKEPVKRSPLKYKSHTHPIFGMKVVGTKVSHSLITLSSDGTVCEWNKCDLEKEPKRNKLVEKIGTTGTNQFQDVSTVCLGFRRETYDKFFVGSENGSMYSAFLYGTKEGIDQKYEGHYGTVTGIDFHPNAHDFGDYVLTSSVDWSCALWNQKQEKAIYSFTDYDNYVYDVKWSPVNPAMFATVDGSGQLKLWNLNSDTETPIFKTDVESSKSINKLCWNSSGTHIAVGSVTGKIFLYKLNDEISKPKENEKKKFRSTLVKMNLSTNEI